MSLSIPAVRNRLREGPTSRLERLHSLSKKPLAFWFLNQWLEEPELSRQIGELKEKGFGGFFMHPRGGLEVPYGSRRWFEVIKYCTLEAKKIGLEAWLYDEDPYPSGAAGGQVIMENSAFQAVELVSREVCVDEAGGVILDLPKGMLHAVYLIDQEGIHEISAEAGIVRTKWHQGMRLNGYYPPYECGGSPHWRAEAHSPHFRVVTTVQSVPAKIIGFVRVPIEQNPWGAFPDLMNGEAVDAFLRLTYRRYHDRLGSEIGITVPGIFTDESKLRGMIPWTPRIDLWTQEVGNVFFSEVLPHLALELNAETPWFRWVYREALARAFLSQFVDRIRRACDEFDLLWTGHFSPEEDPIGQVLYVPGLFRVLRRMEIPGTDLIGSNLGNSRSPLLHLSPKIASSVAHLSGTPYVSCEALAVTDWVQNFEFITKAIHWLFALGVNRIVTHGQYYSIDGLRKREAPPSQFYQASGWEHISPLMLQIERLSELLTQGEHHAPVLIYYPEETFMVLAQKPESSPSAENSVVWNQRERLGTLVHGLLTSGYDFDFIDGEKLHDLDNDYRGELVLNDLQNKRYQVLVVPGCYFAEETWVHLNRLKSQGATILFLEPELTILKRNPWTINVGPGYSDTALFNEIRRIVSPLWAADGELIGHLRDTAGGPLLFLCNNSDRAFRGSVKVIFSGPYELCDPAIGKWYFAGDALFLELPPGLGVLIRQTQGHQSSPYLLSTAWTTMLVDWGQWTATPLSENALLLHRFSLINRPRQASEVWHRAINQRDEADVSLPSIIDFYSGRFVDLASPASTRDFVDHGDDRYLMTAFDWSGSQAAVRLVCDHDLLPVPEDGQTPLKLFFINGIPLHPLVRRRTFDPMNLEVDLSEFIHEGRNTLIWVQPGTGNGKLVLPYDGLRLFGSFEAESPFMDSSLVKLAPRPQSYRCGMPVAPQLFGHAHYHGIVAYSCKVTLPVVPKRCALRFQKVYESMEVIINGHSAGFLWKEPYLLEIPSEILNVGQNEVVLHCSTSPANYLQGLQRPAGCMGPIEWCAAP